MDEFLTSYGSLPESLTSAENYGIALASDSSDCSADGVCPADSGSDCGSDGGSCTSDCNDCSDCSDCNDCADAGNASYSITDYTDTTVTIAIQGLVPGSSTYKFFVRLTADPSDSTISTSTTTAAASTVTRTFGGLLPGTSYTANVNVNGEWLGATTFTTDEAGRPNNWSWISTIAKGQPIQISASEWNSFCARINEFREYKKLTAYSFTSAVKGNDISAAIVNQAWTAINAISGHGTMPAKAVQDGPIYASFFTGLASALNAIS